MNSGVPFWERVRAGKVSPKVKKRIEVKQHANKQTPEYLARKAAKRAKYEKRRREAGYPVHPKPTT